ncbi:MAG TPA: malonic semialdehyde reductase [Galbitalea sp.]|nr:malonic semialdehyde reductase [Galbitalea sp.]
MTSLTEAPLAPLHRLDDASKAALFTDAQTAYSFAPNPVSEEELTAIWDLAKWPPTSANFQPMRVIFVQSPAARARLVAYMNDNNKERVQDAPAVAVLAYDRRFHTHIPTVAPQLSSRVETFEANEDVRLDAARSNGWIQAGYFLLAIRAQGLGAGPMAGFDGAAIDADFFEDGNWGAFLVVNIGHPTKASFRARQPRLELEHTVRFA